MQKHLHIRGKGANITQGLRLPNGMDQVQLTQTGVPLWTSHGLMIHGQSDLVILEERVGAQVPPPPGQQGQHLADQCWGATLEVTQMEVG